MIIIHGQRVDLNASRVPYPELPFVTRFARPGDEFVFEAIFLGQSSGNVSASCFLCVERQLKWRLSSCHPILQGIEDRVSFTHNSPTALAPRNYDSVSRNTVGVA